VVNIKLRSFDIDSAYGLLLLIVSGIVHSCHAQNNVDTSCYKQYYERM